MNVLVTGTRQGLGLSLAIYLHEHGYDVTGCARGERPDVPFAHVPGVDFADRRSFAKLDAQLGETDALVNNVGIAADGLIVLQAEDALAEVIGVNLTATLLLTRRYVRKRLERGRPGVIVNISSIVGLRGYAGLAAYSASKAGLDGMTRSLARELGAKGFRVNSVLPGYLETGMSQALDAAQKRQIVRRTPLGRLGTVEDVAPVVEFLISDRARFITGQSIVVDGGITV